MVLSKYSFVRVSLSFLWYMELLHFLAEFLLIVKHQLKSQ